MNGAQASWRRQTPALVGELPLEPARNPLGAWQTAAWVSIVVWGVIAPFAAMKPLGNDEIYTWHVAMQPGFASIWRALAGGADNLPPLDYWLRHLSLIWFGPSTFAFRLPALLAVWIAAVVLAHLVASRSTRALGWAAGLLLLLTGGFDAALTGRGYALLLCTFAVSLAAWEALASGRSPVLASAALFVAMVGAVYSHYDGVLQIGAVCVAAALARLRDRDLAHRAAVLVTLAAAACAPLVPLARVASRFRHGFWTSVNTTALRGIYPALIAPAVPCLILIGAAAAMAKRGAVGEPRMAGAGLSTNSVHLLLAYLAAPIALYVLARIGTGAFLPRYVIASGVAIALLPVLLLVRHQTANWIVTGALILAPAVCLAAVVATAIGGLQAGRFRVEFTKQLAQFAHTATVPVVIGDDGVFVEVSNADHAGNLANCFFLYDPFPRQPTNVDFAIEGLQRIWHLNAMPFDSFLRGHRQFAFIGTNDDRVVQRAEQDGAAVQLLRDSGTGLEYFAVSY